MKYFRIINIVLVSVFTMLAIASCKRENDTATPVGTDSVTFSFSSPAEGATYKLGDTVWIKGTISYPADMHGYEIKLTNKTTDSLVVDVDDHVHNNTIPIYTFWVNNVADHSEMQLQIDAEIDHDGNKQTKNINFHCHPM